MRIPFALFGLLIVVWVALPSVADDKEKLPSRVHELVRQLDDDQRARRDEAEKALVELGPEAMEFFPRITPRTPAEVEDRLSRIRKQLEIRMAEETARPSRVTLKGMMTLADALRSLEEQTGNKIVGFERRGGDIDVDFDQRPYWEVLDKLLDEADLTINAFGGEMGAIVVQAKAETELPRYGNGTYSGVFRFEATHLESRRDLRNPSVDGMRLNVAVSWEPRVRPITLQQSLSKIEAIDDRGEALTIDMNRGSSNRSSLSASAESGISEVDLRIPISLPERASKQIASLKGELTVLVPGSVETFEFENIAKGRDVERQKAGVTVTFERLRRNVNLWEVRMSVRFDDAADALESHRGWVFQNEAYLLDQDGQQLENVGFQATRQEANEVGVAYLFAMPDGPQGCKFVYKTPATILRLPVPFEIKDIDLP